MTIHLMISVNKIVSIGTYLANVLARMMDASPPWD